MFDKLKSVLSKASGNLVQADLGRLNTLGKGLGDKAVRYVSTGQDGTVLSTLANTQIPANLLFGARIMDDQTSVLARRRTFFLDAAPYDPELMARYAQVLHASRENGTITNRELAGPDNADPVLRLFFGLAFAGAVENINAYPRKPRKDPVEGMTPDMAVRIGAAQGASAADVMAILLTAGSYWGSAPADHYLDLVDMKSYMAGHPEIIVAANKQLNAESRVALAARLGKYGLASQPAYLELMFDFAGGSAKSVRDAALNVLLGQPADVVEARATEILGKGTVAAREAMTGLLAKLGTETAISALRGHLQTEKTARIRSAIENLLMTTPAAPAAEGATPVEDDATGYTALDGSRVDIPPLRDLDDDMSIQFGKDVRQRVLDAVLDFNAAARKVNEELKRKKQKWGHWQVVKSPEEMADGIITLFNTGVGRGADDMQRHYYSFLNQRAPKLFTELTSQMPLKRLLKVALSQGYNNTFRLSSFLGYHNPPPVRAWLGTPEADMRVVENLLIEKGKLVSLGVWHKSVERPYRKGDLLYEMMPKYDWISRDLDAVANEAIWPLVAQNLTILDAALGVSANSEIQVRNQQAVALLQKLPKTPLRFIGPLLEIATGEAKGGRAEARALLADAAGVDERLIALLSDSRQAVRAGSAEWLAQRQCSAAIPALKARLKKEKSELARAAILTALKELGEDLSSFVGPTALIREAETGLKKAKLDKLEWMGLDHLPKLKWSSGKSVPDDVVRWWLFLANKLKQPGGNALFEIYLDQLAPESAEALSSWVFDSWLAFDTVQRSEAEGIEHAQARVDASYKSWVRWEPDISKDAVFQMLKREITSQYVNSGAASKGVLALARRVPATHAADRVRHFLRTHGKRTSQATALLEMLAAKGDPVSLQVVIGAATRLKQKGVQAKAAEMVEAVAEARGWSLSELADRTIPTGGLDDDGVLELPCGPEEKLYHARLGDDMALTLTNPDGKPVKALPAGDDDNTKAAKKQLSVSKKEIKQVSKAQADRLYEALCAERVWPVADWARDFQDHPVMRRLTPRVVWLGLDRDDRVIGAFRPTPEGDLTDAEDNSVDLDRFTKVRLAHGALLSDAEADAWQNHLADYEITPLFSQFGRPLLRLDDDLKEGDEIIDRQGWLTDAFTIRGAASKLGYDRGEALDGGFFCDYIKPFKSADVIAVIEFSGNGLPEENVTAVLKKLTFVTHYSGYSARKIPLKDVPPVLLSECWNDYHEMTAKAQFDPDWEKKVPW